MSLDSRPRDSRPLRFEGEGVGLVLLALGFMLAIILFLPFFNPGSGGYLVQMRAQLLDPLGWSAYLLPLVPLAYGLRVLFGRDLRQLTRQVGGGLLVVGGLLTLHALLRLWGVAVPGTPGRLAEQGMAVASSALSYLAALLPLTVIALGLELMLRYRPFTALRSVLRGSGQLLGDATTRIQGALEARRPGEQSGAAAQSRTDVRQQLAKHRRELEDLRRLYPHEARLREQLDAVRRRQREVRAYTGEQLRGAEDDLEGEGLKLRNFVATMGHDLREGLKNEVPPEAQSIEKFMAQVSKGRHELSVRLPSTQASAALERVRRGIERDLIDLGTLTQKLMRERKQAEKRLQPLTSQVLLHEHPAHQERKAQWQEVQDKFRRWQAQEKLYPGWPDLAAAFDAGPADLALRLSRSLEQHPWETLAQADAWRTELEEARRRGADALGEDELPESDETDLLALARLAGAGDAGGGAGLLGKLRRSAGKLGRHEDGPPGAPPSPAARGPEEGEPPGKPRPAFLPPQPLTEPSPSPLLHSQTAPQAAAVPQVQIEFSAATRPSPAHSPRPAPAAAPLLSLDLTALTAVPASLPRPPGRPPSTATSSARPPALPARPQPAPAAPESQIWDDLWDDEEDLPFGPPARGVGTPPAPRPVRSQPEPAPWDAPAASGSVTVSAAPRPAPGRVAPPQAQGAVPQRRGAIPVALPTEKLLNPIPDAARGAVQMDTAARQRGSMIDETLRQFGLQARVVDLARGPTVTRYEIEPAPGEKISRIASLSNDLARALAVGGVRVEAPVPGKSVIGLEVPNAEREPVTFHQATASGNFRNSRAKLPIILGKSIDGSMMVGDLAKMPHLLVAGSTGSGKSVCVNTLITSLLYKYLPSELRFLMIDPKMVELTPYDGIPHLVRGVVTNPTDAAGVLLGAVAHMERRYKMMSQVGAKNLEQFNAKMRQVGEVELPYLVIIIDELADLMITSPKEVESAIMRLAQMARATGMHLILATQRPSVDILTSLIKVNIPARIAFAVSSSHDSRTILDTTGAERLTGQGDMLFYQPGLVKPLRLQGPYIDEVESVRIADELRRMVFEDAFVESYGADFEGLVSSSGPSGDRSQLDFSDPLLRQAALVCIEEGQGSVSRLQRRLSVGHARAGKLMDLLEAMRVVGPHQGSKPREVLISEADLPEYFGK
ncbi:DNA segregation ATPase FtsK/SpoIIIE, S-DNA-T family [Deinococcus reticulitermitis]|uniref:DNA segregation ATPase FtsK/SpoIIIE, S-DNA-T family n=1 Tax=Deinococcus reticulitermitis TaxID=856736 RepID=A0A1H6UCU4_9DEIO|nr:DNA translocase FtsK [Deinococcus reticulitermitis]SEI86015.1 DNA segregation ATPase FtsK/SpoIIIE, S-DNA-T family [Deinococcus reticulitermitis]